jgi:hypothetical protein
VNLLVKKVKRVGHGFRNFDNYRLRLLLHCGALADSPNRNTTRPLTALGGLDLDYMRTSGEVS